MIEVLVWPGLAYDAPVLMPYFLSDTMTMVLFWVLVPYDVLVVSPYFWVKVALGIATGLFIPGRIVGLLACALGNAAIVSYTAFAVGHLGSLFNLTLPNQPTSLSSALIGLLMMSIFLFVGVVWWFVGRIMRWAFYKIAHAVS
ncbi:MAG: hypothetical protein WCD56_02625 [Pseudolabrys sp.]|jgi:hypothetical protein